MKRLSVLFLLFLSCVKLNAQLIQKSELEKFNWFTDNYTKSFYKSDTISLITISDPPLSHFFELNRRAIELECNDTNNVTEIKFKSKNKLDISDHDINSGMVTTLVGKWSWRFNLKTQIITFYFKGKLKSSFMVKDRFTKSMIWKFNFSNEEEVDTYHLLILTLVRLKT